tara:strand:+ start:141 stop:422 length:282 start_codon:yes stop_codon:yes gene_type:complete
MDQATGDVILLAIVAGGAVIGALISFVRNDKVAFGLLLTIPLVVIGLIYVELADPNRQGDAQDGLLYIFGPLWPSVGALIGFLLGRWCLRKRT